MGYGEGVVVRTDALWDMEGVVVRTDALWDMEGAVVRTDALWDMEGAVPATLPSKPRAHVFPWASDPSWQVYIPNVCTHDPTAHQYVRHVRQSTPSGAGNEVPGVGRVLSACDVRNSTPKLALLLPVREGLHCCAVAQLLQLDGCFLFLGDRALPLAGCLPSFTLHLRATPCRMPSNRESQLVPACLCKVPSSHC